MDSITVEVSPEQEWECVECGWKGRHADSGDKTIVRDGMWALICPVCGSDEFYKA